MRYKLPIEMSVKIVTLITFLIPVVIFYWFYTLEILLVGGLISTLLLILFVVVYTYTPKEVVLERSGLVIKKVLGQVVVPYDKIKEVFFFERFNWKTIRVFGSGGLFGWFGLFYIEKIGKVWVYARRRKDLVLIKADKNYLIAPEDPKRFIENLKTMINKKEK
ncbi:MAG: PH domain-containing protein [Archaeoglobaceae archaeon]|nr:PH domain-containing protein [Archaeoglobaceae archaeon]MCX8151502.1 PH domain-containing protein [Archaeoglobaceae archaeon]MDW8014022.1 PH domain-containing protein [Archaeoglobaceae archaeon]